MIITLSKFPKKLNKIYKKVINYKLILKHRVSVQLINNYKNQLNLLTFKIIDIIIRKTLKM